MFRTIFGVWVVAIALVALAGCGAQEPETPEQSETARKAANYEVFKDPAVREALKSDPAAGEKYSRELERNALPGEAPSTGAVETPPVTPGGETPPAGGETAPAAGETPAAEGEAKPAADEAAATAETPTE